MNRVIVACLAALAFSYATPYAAQLDLAFPSQPEREVKLPGRGAFTGARLYAPEGAGPFPAVVLSHTCGPLRQHIFEWAQRFLGAGYAVLVVDHLGPRRVATNCPNFTVTVTEYAQDDVAAMRHLRSMPFVDGNRIVQMGFSYGEVFPLDILFYPIFKAAGFFLRNRIIWHYGHGLHMSKRFSGRYETLLWFTKTGSYTFNLDAVRVPSKYPGKRYYKGPKKGKPSGNPNGKNPSDVWTIVARDWELAVWEIPNVKANHPEKTIQPCQFPVELAERCVLALSNASDLVLDPYAGVGSALIAAAIHGRRSLGAEKEELYYRIALERLERLRKGTLPIRPLGRPIYSPSPNERVAKQPEEWSPTRKRPDPTRR